MNHSLITSQVLLSNSIVLLYFLIRHAIVVESLLRPEVLEEVVLADMDRCLTLELCIHVRIFMVNAGMAFTGKPICIINNARTVSDHLFSCYNI